jgi:hypothetical protein
MEGAGLQNRVDRRKEGEFRGQKRRRASACCRAAHEREASPHIALPGQTGADATSSLVLSEPQRSVDEARNRKQDDERTAEGGMCAGLAREKGARSARRSLLPLQCRRGASARAALETRTRETTPARNAAPSPPPPARARQAERAAHGARPRRGRAVRPISIGGVTRRVRLVRGE